MTLVLGKEAALFPFSHGGGGSDCSASVPPTPASLGTVTGLTPSVQTGLADLRPQCGLLSCGCFSRQACVDIQPISVILRRKCQLVIDIQHGMRRLSAAWRAVLSQDALLKPAAHELSAGLSVDLPAPSLLCPLLPVLRPDLRDGFDQRAKLKPVHCPSEPGSGAPW